MTLSALVAGAPIRMGASGEAVRAVRLALAGLGYKLTGTGYFGAATDTAVEDFQRRHGLDDDGVVGPATAAAIEAALRTGAPPAEAVTAPLHLTVSLQHVGLKEGAGRSNNPELIADIKTVAPDYTSDETPWCAGWVSFCLAKAGLKPSRSPLWARSYAEGWGIKLPGPTLGCVAVKTRTGGGHVTFVAGRTRTGRLACCGGNQNNEVNVTGYPESAFNLGFWWPKDYPMPDAAMIGAARLPLIDAAGRALSEA